MANQIDYKPFATASGANVLTQAQYEALAALAGGFTTGQAPSAAFNKIWRQSSVAASALATFIAGQLNQDVLDDGNVAGLSSAIEQAIQTLISNAGTELFNDRGNYDASSDQYPSTGGSGTAGMIVQGDIWTISVAGTLGGVAVQGGDTVRALVTAPGQTEANWAIQKNTFSADTSAGFIGTNDGFGDIQTSLNARSLYVRTHAEAQALTLTQLTATPALTIAGRTAAGDDGGGDFDYLTGDFSAEVAVDTAHAVYLPVTAIPTTTGILKRRNVTAINAKWAGAKGDAMRYGDGSVGGASFNELSSPSYTFVSADVGKTAFIFNYDSSNPGAWNSYTISSVSSGVATLSASLPAAVTNTAFYLGSDDGAAIQAANAAASLFDGLYFPKGNYLDTTSTGMTPNDNATYFGDGAQSVVVSININFSQTGLQISNIGALTYYPLNNLVAGSQSVTTTTAANAGNITPNQLVYIRSTATDGYGVPAYGEINRALNVDATTGVVTLENQLEDDWTSVEISPLAAGVVPQKVLIRDLGLVASTYPWACNGAYRCEMRDFWFEARDAVAGNAMTFCDFHDFNGLLHSGTVVPRIAEFALNSYKSTVRNVKASMQTTPGTSSTADSTIIFHELSRDCFTQNIQIDAPGVSFNSVVQNKGIRCGFNNLSGAVLNAKYSIQDYCQAEMANGGTVIEKHSFGDGYKINHVAGFDVGVFLNTLPGYTWKGANYPNMAHQGAASSPFGSYSYAVFQTGGGTLQDANVQGIIDGTCALNASDTADNVRLALTSNGPADAKSAAGFVWDRPVRKNNAGFPQIKKVPYFTSTSTTSGNSLGSLTIPASMRLLQGDLFKVICRGNLQPGTFTLNLKILVGGNTVFNQDLSVSASSVNFDVDGIVSLGGGSFAAVANYLANTRFISGTTVSTQYSAGSFNPAVSNTIDVQGYISSGSGTFSISELVIVPVLLEENR